MSAKLNSVFVFIIVFFMVGTVGTISSAYGQETDKTILSLLKERDKEIKAKIAGKDELPETERAELKDLVNGIIDFEQMAEDAMGKEWEKLTSEQQAEFVKVFSEIVRGRSLADLEIYRLDVAYDDVQVEGETARVFTTTVYKDQPMKVEYAMGLRDNNWRVDDIILDGVSTTDGYARSFQTYVRKRGFDALMANLHKRLAKINGTS